MTEQVPEDYGEVLTDEAGQKVIGETDWNVRDVNFFKLTFMVSILLGGVYLAHTKEAWGYWGISLLGIAIFELFCR